jgi:hypothetical protein
LGEVAVSAINRETDLSRMEYAIQIFARPRCIMNPAPFKGFAKGDATRSAESGASKIRENDDCDRKGKQKSKY